jgi:hypothetical protein
MFPVNVHVDIAALTFLVFIMDKIMPSFLLQRSREQHAIIATPASFDNVTMQLNRAFLRQGSHGNDPCVDEIAKTRSTTSITL